jgi:hypothetical protein
MAIEIQDSDLEALRYQIETVGYVEYTVAASNFDNTPAVPITLVGKAVESTFPVPPDCCVVAIIEGACFYNDDSNAEGESLSIVAGGFRDGTGNVVALDEINGAGDYLDLTTQMSSEAGATGSMITVAVAADTTNQGIDITLAADAAADSGYFLGRMRLICAKNGGLPKAYTN